MNETKIIKWLLNQIKKITALHVIIVLMLFILIWVYLWNKQKNNASETIIIENIQTNNSDIELLKKAKIEIEVRIDKKEKETKCYKQQLERKINKLEYSIEYCYNETNLEKFSDLN